MSPPPPPQLSPSTLFQKKKSTILSAIATPLSPYYTDNSPKGTIDVEIIDLIDEINAFDGYVTTSSCAGRVAAFVEGRGATIGGNTATVTVVDDNGGNDGDGGESNDGDSDVNDNGITATTATTTTTRTNASAGPGGKGHGNKWLYVSHEPVSVPISVDRPQPESQSRSWHEIFGLTPSNSNSTSPSHTPPTYPPNPRLIKLTFSPLILHILCSSLQTARPLLAAAINAGFRESGIQSLKILEERADSSAGVMLAIRTAGCAFETVVGYVEEDGGGEGEVYRSVVSEEWLGVCVGVVNGRFVANGERRERLRGEIKGIKSGGGSGNAGRNGDGEEWEDKESRRVRKREEGLRIKKEKEKEMQRAGSDGMNGDIDMKRAVEDDSLGGGLLLQET